MARPVTERPVREHVSTVLRMQGQIEVSKMPPKRKKKLQQLTNEMLRELQAELEASQR